MLSISKSAAALADQPAARFRNKYIFKTKAYRVISISLRCYVCHTEAYIARCPDIRLSQPSAFRLEQDLSENCDSHLVQGWLFQKIVQALEILFIEMIKPGRVTKFDWQKSDKVTKELVFSHVSILFII